MTPLSWVYSRAAAICEPSFQASSSGIGPFGSTPSTSSITSVFDTVDGRDVGMVERGQDLGFALEASHAFGVAGERFGEDLQRNIALQLGVARAVHLAHAARAE